MTSFAFAPTAADINNLLSGVKATLDTAKRIREIYEQDYALEFNPLLSFFSIGENKFSEMIAYFLDPQAKHGQGSIFLKLLLEKFELTGKVDNFEKPDIAIEHRIENDRRIDLYLSFNNGFQLAIENKLWAVDQPRQLFDYNSYLCKSGKDHCLIYLTPYCREPDESSISKTECRQLESSGKLQRRSYAEDFSGLITEWIAACRADKVKSFLKDLYQYIQHHINGEKFMGETDLIVDQLLTSENFKTAFKIQKAANATIEKLLSLFKLDLEEIGKKNGWVLSHFNLNSNAGRYAAFHFKINTIQADTVIAFEFGDSGFSNFYWGIYNVDAKIKNWQKGGELLAKHLLLSNNKPEQYFLWSKYHEYGNWDENVFEKIRNRTLSHEIEKNILEVFPGYEKAVLENPSLFSVPSDDNSSIKANLS